jgi:Cu-processing system permease protein
MKTLVKYVLLDLLRNRMVLIYTALLLILSLSTFNLEDNAAKGVLTLLNFVLIFVPLFSILFSTIYIYNAAEFIELLVAQPLPRKKIWLSLYAGLALALSMAYGVGCGLVVILYTWNVTGFLLGGMGLLLSFIFIGLALLAAVNTRDKARGIGKAILLWFYFALLFDGIVLFLLFQFMDYPLETPILIASMLNPVDLARIMILLKLDESALMGATSALFKEFFGTLWGIAWVFGALLIWALVPLGLSLRSFIRKDL